jgi:hypothetical protein
VVAIRVVGRVVVVVVVVGVVVVVVMVAVVVVVGVGLLLVVVAVGAVVGVGWEEEGELPTLSAQVGDRGGVVWAAAQGLFLSE